MPWKYEARFAAVGGQQWCKLLNYLPVAFTSTKFLWLESDHRFDCIVGISVQDEPVGIGTLIYNDTVVTSANPLEPHLNKTESKDTKYHDPENKIKLHVIDNHWDTSKTLEIENFTADVSKRNEVWIKMGFDRRHTSIHDLIFISIKHRVETPPVTGRQAFYLNKEFTSYFTNGWTFAGFGYVDYEHINNNTLLETHTYEDSDEADCDEWIPRAWGRFVCLVNVADVDGIQSGAPLFQNGMLRGVGSFALKKGKESILVFTDFSLYREFLEAEKQSMMTQAP